MSHTGLMQESVEALLKQDRDYLWHHLTQHKVFQTSEPLVMVEGRGLILKDIRGREYLDAASG
ncbi:MAG: aspartate aminotransferase family protein, partial [Deltaproteobacteria bacterium]|nr:aspartate aminotransferase family protein [Deltaproteobacteria bacterium]